ncbi:methylmalonyl-CoA mutase family protein [Agrobacterium sp. ES01]|uniref:methylmalonyl-CoA mutase family protein n=1 Tax=Agrobacterium sp. ES01 TaxID=3420714 RepID=UPI003D12870C
MDARILEDIAFAGNGRDNWQKLVEKALKGADFAATLTSASDDGLVIEPLYARRKGAHPLARQSSGGWTVAQRMDDPDEKRALVQMADDLENGATGISLVCGDSPCAYGLGLDQMTASLLSRLAAARAAHRYAIRLEGGSLAVDGAQELARAIDTAGGNGGAIHFGIDPMSAMVFSGNGAQPGKFAEAVKSLKLLDHAGSILTASGRAVHNAGGTEAQELAFMAAALAHYLREMDAAGMDAGDTFALCGLALSADQDQFLTIAKGRAARLIVARMQEICGISKPSAAHLMMETSYRMLTRLDPETNILRNTTAVFAAGVGGADEVTVLSHTLTHGNPDPLARRLARNTQVILMAESHLDQVCDPAAGAGGIEALTDGLCEAAWEIFMAIEKNGGIIRALTDGSFAASVASKAKSRVSRPIVGTTLFPMDKERAVTVLGPLEKCTASGLAPTLLSDRAE